MTKGGRHNTKVHCIHNGQKYPLPTSHKVVNKHIIKDFGEWLARNGLCTIEDYDVRIK